METEFFDIQRKNRILIGISLFFIVILEFLFFTSLISPETSILCIIVFGVIISQLKAKTLLEFLKNHIKETLILSISCLISFLMGFAIAIQTNIIFNNLITTLENMGGMLNPFK